MSLVSGSAAPYIASDQILADQIVYELKSQGIFDSFRKECIADVDTKPAYQNLRQRVEGSVSSFLKEQKWKPESNKNQLREMLRKNIYESGFLETGVERIVNQVVNPKINTVFLPKVQEVFYKYIGLQTTPVTTEENSYVDTTLNIEDEPITQNLLPTELEAISPENDNVDIEATEDSNSMAIDDDDTSPPFEPIDEDLSFKLIPTEDNSIDSHLSGMSGLVSQNSEQNNKDKTVAMQHLLESDSQVSKNSSSDDRLSIVTDEASNAKVDILVGNDGVVGAMETTETSEDNEDNKNEKLTNLRAVCDENFQELKDKHTNKAKVTMNESVTEDSTDLKASEETSNLQIKDEMVEDSKINLSSETLDSTIKPDAVDSTSKHISSHKKDVSRDHKKDSSRHHNSLKSRDKSKDAKAYRESKSKSAKSKSSSSTKDRDKDSKSKSNSSSASNKHSSDKEYSSNKRHSSSSSKDKNSSGSTKDKSSSSKDKDKNIATSGSKEKDNSVSSKYKESSKDHSSSGKGSTSSSRDKSSSKDHSKDGKSKSTPSTDKSYKSEHRSSSSRKHSTSHTSRDDSSKSQISSSTNTDKRDKKDNSMKDDHFSSKTQRTDRRSTDRDSNDGQTKNKGGSACNAGTTLLLKSEEQRSNNNTTEDNSSSNSNSKDGSNSDCCQTGDETAKIVPDEIQVKDIQTEICDNLQPIVATNMKDLQNYTETKLVESVKGNEEKNNSAVPLASPSIESSEVPKSNVPDFVETLDAIKSHLAEYKLHDQKDKILSTITLPKFASNFREARKIMKLRKQLKKQSKLRKIMLKGNNITTDIEQGSIEECPNRESSETLNAVVHIGNTDDNTSNTSLAILEQDLSIDTTIKTVENMENVNTNEEMIKTNSNDDCLYLGKISEKTTRYLNYTSSFIETLSKEISVPQIKAVNKKRKAQKRKISTISSDSSINNDNNPDQSFPNFKVTTPPPNCNSTSDSIPASKGDVEPMSSGGDTAGVTSATAHVHVKQRRLNNSKATQRYTSDDLYKPRPFLKGTTKRTSGRVAD